MSTTDARDNKPRLPRDERRALLLSAALEVFTAAGYHSAAMDEIADRAGVSKPVLYQHFPSKLELYLAVLDLHIDSLVFQIQRSIAANTENADRVRATVDAYFDFIESEGEAFRLLFEILGPVGYLTQGTPGAVVRARLETMYRGMLILTFGGGTNEMQRDLITMFSLGFPRAAR